MQQASIVGLSFWMPAALLLPQARLREIPLNVPVFLAQSGGLLDAVSIWRLPLVARTPLCQ